MAHKIDTVTARGKLKSRREPYWHKLGKGKAVGYRAGADTWVARWRNAEDKQEYNPLGLKEHDSKEVFEVACEAARTWFLQCEGGGNVVLTVQTGCEEYLDDLEHSG
jgi:hypothetical protein